jgi:mannose-6-phosphate isomerase-like protein (cupin superfamily)
MALVGPRPADLKVHYPTGSGIQRQLKVPKGWGHEIIFADVFTARAHLGYTGKLLCFGQSGSRCSLHQHLKKDEVWYVLEGIFDVEYRNLDTGEHMTTALHKGDAWRNEPGFPHRLICLSEGGTILEVSTKDDPDDNKRLSPGDSQEAGSLSNEREA